MKTEELIVTPPKGFEIDYGKSVLEAGKPMHIVFKKMSTVPKTWEEIMILKEGNCFYLTDESEIKTHTLFYDPEITDVDDCKIYVNTEVQAKKLIALAQLFVIADHYNEGWVPNWNLINEYKYYFYWNSKDGQIVSDYYSASIKNPIVFKNKAIALEAYENNREIFDAFYKP